MTLTLSNTEQLKAVIAALNVGVVEPTKPSPCVGHAVETAKEETKAAAEVAKVADKPEAFVQMTGSEAAQALHGHANNPADAPTYQATADAVTKLAREKGRDAAIAVLTKFGAAKLPDVKPEQFAAVIAACEEAGA